MQQALAYAEMLDAPFAISSNGDGFLIHDRTGLSHSTECEVSLDQFPCWEELWQLYQQWKGVGQGEPLKIIEQPYFTDASGREPRYYQRERIGNSLIYVSYFRINVRLDMGTFIMSVSSGSLNLTQVKEEASVK